MHPSTRIAALLLGSGCAALAAGSPASPSPVEAGAVRVALFNIRELSTDKLLEVDSLGRGTNSQLLAAAAIVREIDPDVLVLNELDHDLAGAPQDLALNARRFAAAYLDRSGDGAGYGFTWAPPCNTGILSGLDLNRDGRVATEADRGTREHGGDSFGFGVYPGQYSLAVLSKLPLDGGRARSWQRLLWKDLPGAHLPEGFWGDEELAGLRLSSKTHAALPLAAPGDTLWLLLSHPTPPGFDGPEDRNGRRNFDELRLWSLLLGDSAAPNRSGESAGADSPTDGELLPFADDAGSRTPLPVRAPLLLVGDLNAGPESAAVDGAGLAIDQLLGHPRLQDGAPWLRRPAPPGGWTEGDPRAGWTYGGEERGRRIDHLLPSLELRAVGGGVVWPDSTADPQGNARALRASDHRLVWMDLDRR